MFSVNGVFLFVIYCLKTVDSFQDELNDRKRPPHRPT